MTKLEVRYDHKSNSWTLATVRDISSHPLRVEAEIAAEIESQRRGLDVEEIDRKAAKSAR